MHSRKNNVTSASLTKYGFATMNITYFYVFTILPVLFCLKTFHQTETLSHPARYSHDAVEKMLCHYIVKASKAVVYCETIVFPLTS